LKKKLYLNFYIINNTLNIKSGMHKINQQSFFFEILHVDDYNWFNTQSAFIISALATTIYAFFSFQKEKIINNNNN
jgi:hypothetical protein